MMPAVAVIGAAWGDEGKGLMVDHLSDAQTMVVRFNGGAQAGHTVVTPDGRRHVFSHVGAGAFQGAGTFLSRHFILNPLLFEKEHKALLQSGVVPEIIADEDAMVTTPWDMLINQSIEDARGIGRHGSCGVGINETVTRSVDPKLTIRVADLMDGGRLRATATLIRDEYHPARCAALGLERNQQERTFASLSAVMEGFLDRCDWMINRVAIMRERRCINSRYSRLVFEGAQGLALDEVRGEFPHVTRSRTGLTNVISLMDELGIPEAQAIYVTRAYATRHGAGPFRTHLPNLTYADDTNAPHAYQGALRFGRLDLDQLAEDIAADLEGQTRIQPSVAVTHLDQVAGFQRSLCAGESIREFSTEGGLLAAIAEGINLPVLHTSHGPTREHVTPTQVQYAQENVR